MIQETAEAAVFWSGTAASISGACLKITGMGFQTGSGFCFWLYLFRQLDGYIRPAAAAEKDGRNRHFLI